MRIAVEPELEMLRDALSAQAMTSVRPLADQVDRGQAFSWNMWAAVRDLGSSSSPQAKSSASAASACAAAPPSSASTLDIVGRELLARCGS